MIKELSIKNFRSIREASLELGRFTILNGANNSGKSSVLYALQVLKNVVTNPNRSVDELFNLGFLNLGGLQEAINKSTTSKHLEISVRVSKKNAFKTESLYGIGFNRSGSYLRIAGIHPLLFDNRLSISFPYPINKQQLIKVQQSENHEFLWNGFQATPVKAEDKIRISLKEQVEFPVQALIQSEVIPTIRGFTKPIFNQKPLNGLFEEEQVATLLAIEKPLQAKVSEYFEQITDRRLSLSMGPGGGFFYLQVREPKSGFATELINQGMGINQILFLLAKILYDKNRLIGIDEPEIHLHPTLIERFVKVLVEIAEKENKQFIFSTHSEHWLMSMLAEVNDGNLKADDLKVYYLSKDGQETKIENQKVFDNGQLEGGLRNFLESEMRLTQRFLD